MSQVYAPAPNAIFGGQILASLTVNGIWFPQEFVGPGCATSSIVVPSGSTGSGFWQVPRTGTLRNFKFVNGGSPGVSIPIDIYIAPNGIPSLFAYSGVSITMPGGSFTAQNVVDMLPVIEGDIIVCYNSSPTTGYTPSTMEITADLYLS